MNSTKVGRILFEIPTKKILTGALDGVYIKLNHKNWGVSGIVYTTKVSAFWAGKIITSGESTIRFALGTNNRRVDTIPGLWGIWW